MTNQLKDLIKMTNAKMDFFLIKECAKSAGFELTSMSVPSLKIELNTLLAHAEMEEECNTLVIL